MLFNMIILVLEVVFLVLAEEEVDRDLGFHFLVSAEKDYYTVPAKNIEKCTFENNTEGVCVHIKYCATALNNIKKNIKPKICKFEDLDTIVCCERSSIKIPDVILTCTLEDEITEGVCIPTRYCPTAIYPYRNHKKREFCYYNHIFCCAKSSKLIDKYEEFATDRTDNSTMCTLRNEGTCVPIENCPKAQKDLKNNKRIIWCGYRNSKFHVCCRNQSKLIEVGAKSIAECLKYNYNYNNADNLTPPLLRGVNSLAQEFPHMAILGFGTETDVQWACGGSLISEKFVLTAAHCLHSPLLGEVNFVRLGDLDISDTTEDAKPQDLKVVSRIKHPNYKGPLKYHDIGLIEVDGPINIDSYYIRPACLHISKKISTSRWIVTGWGSITFPVLHQADHLQKAKIKKYSYEKCNKFHQSSKLNRGIDKDIQICAAGENTTTCLGDSGGPLQIKNNNILSGYTIIGITSNGKACVGSYPGIYTRVSNYIDWIEKIVWPN